LLLLKKTKHQHQGENIKNNFNSNYFCHLPLLLTPGSKRPSINKGKDATNRIWIPIVLPFTDVDSDEERLRKNK